MLKKLIGLMQGTQAAPPVSAQEAARARARARAASASATPPGADAADHPAEAALLHAIADRLPADPLMGAKIGAKEVYARLLGGLKTERGVHAESLLCALGSLAGYACQASVRAAAVARGLPETALLTTVETKDGRKFFFGDALNKPLAESRESVWAFAAGAAQAAGCTALPDLGAIFTHVSQTLGSADFGVPRIPEGHAPGDTPLGYLRTLWPALLPLVSKVCPDPTLWPALYGMALNSAITDARQAMAPALALTIAMESAVPMSKIDLAAR